MRQFNVVRKRKESGPDKPGDVFYVHIVGHPELVASGESPGYVFLTAFTGSVGTRAEAQKVCDRLNKAWYNRE